MGHIGKLKRGLRGVKWDTSENCEKLFLPVTAKILIKVHRTFTQVRCYCFT